MSSRAGFIKGQFINVTGGFKRVLQTGKI